MPLTSTEVGDMESQECVLANNHMNHKVFSICFVFSFQFFLQLLCISLVLLIFRYSEAGTKLAPDQLGSLDPGRINSDQLGSTRINPGRPGSTRIDLNLNTIKEKGCFIKEKGYFYAFMD